MNFFGAAFVLYLIKLSDGNGFWKSFYSLFKFIVEFSSHSHLLVTNYSYCSMVVWNANCLTIVSLAYDAPYSYLLECNYVSVIFYCNYEKRNAAKVTIDLWRSIC